MSDTSESTIPFRRFLLLSLAIGFVVLAGSLSFAPRPAAAPRRVQTRAPASPSLAPLSTTVASAPTALPDAVKSSHVSAIVVDRCEQAPEGEPPLAPLRAGDGSSPPEFARFCLPPLHRRVDAAAVRVYAPGPSLLHDADRATAIFDADDNNNNDSEMGTGARPKRSGSGIDAACVRIERSIIAGTKGQN